MSGMAWITGAGGLIGSYVVAAGRELAPDWTLLPITGLAGNMDAIQEVLSPSQWEQFQHPVAIELKKGECSFHHPLMVHGSFENRTDRPRRATVINAFRDGVHSDKNEELLQGVPPIPVGHKMEGQFFPLLYQP